MQGILEQAKKARFINDFIGPFRSGYSGHEENQFYAPFLVSFMNGEKWVLFSTTTLRDRVKENQWDAENIKAIDARITKAILVYPKPKNPKELGLFVKYNERIAKRTIVSAIDEVMSLEDFENLLVKIGKAGKSENFISGAMGRAFEARVSNSLKNKANLRFLKGKNDDSMPRDVELMDTILEKLGIDPNDIDYIFASADDDVIGTLPSRGKPKTDVLANIHLTTGDPRIVTISCKRTDRTTVTIGQHKAEDIADAVDPGNTRLRELLELFQKEGTLEAMSPTDRSELEKELAPVLRRFCYFIIGGVNGLGDPDRHWAKYVMVCRKDPDDYSFYSLEEYVDELLSKPLGNFGTPFHWTYASGCKGKDIQFKVNV